MILLLFIQLSLLRLALCDCSNTSVVSLPVTDVLLSNNNVFRGVPVSVGTPATNISFLPVMYYNDTWIYNTTDTFCNWTTPTGCLTTRGGLYNASSSTAKRAADVYAAGGDPSDTLPLIGPHIWYNAWSTDVMKLGNTSLLDFPIGMPGFDIFSPYDRSVSLVTSLTGLGSQLTIA